MVEFHVVIDKDFLVGAGLFLWGYWLTALFTWVVIKALRY